MLLQRVCFLRLSLARSRARGIRALAPGDFHFNLKAPMVLESTKILRQVNPSEKSHKEVLFRVSESVTSELKVSIYLYDDRDTVCEKKSLKPLCP